MGLDPSTILLPFPAWAKYFTDLTAALFGTPIEEDSQHLFEFTWKGQQLMWSFLPQRFMIVSCFLKDDLEDIILPGGSMLVQCVDDLLLVK